MRRLRTGFTLVELLVVIGIIAVLISILLPALSRAKDQANRTACMSNMRQLVTAFMLYAMDHKDKCPLGSRADNPGNVDLPGDWIHWRNLGKNVNNSAIVPYIKLKDDALRRVLRCPADRPETRTFSGAYQFSYSMNMYFEPRAGYFPMDAGPPVKLGSTKRAANKILFAEENEKTINDGFWAAGNYTGTPPTINNWVVNWDWLSIRHDNSKKESEPATPSTGALANLPNNKRVGVAAFADGHVDLISRFKAHSPENVIPRY